MTLLIRLLDNINKPWQMTKSSILLTILEYETSAEPVSVLIQSIEESVIDVFETLITHTTL